MEDESVEAAMLSVVDRRMQRGEKKRMHLMSRLPQVKAQPTPPSWPANELTSFFPMKPFSAR